MADKKTTTDETVDAPEATSVIRPRGRKNAIQLLGIAEDLGYDASVVRPLSDGYEVPTKVAEKFDPEKDVEIPEHDSHEISQDEAEAWTESTIHPDEAHQDDATIATEAKFDAENTTAVDPGTVEPSAGTELADGEQENADAESKAKADADAADEKAAADKAAADKKSADDAAKTATK